jgi:two-component system sensor histidine kinase HydH
LPPLGPPPLGPPPLGPPLIVIVFAPPVTARLHAAMDRTVWVGGAAVALLLGLAGWMTREASRRDAEGIEAERQRRLASLGEMSSVMAHELRNPLASLKGHAQLLLESLGEARDRAMAERVVHEAERLERLTSDLLDFVRDGPVDRAAVDPVELVARAAALVPRAVVKIDSRAAPGEASLDETRLLGALANLIRNAHQAAGDQPIDARVTARGGDLVIEIRDRGPGLPAGAEGRIFEPFVTSRVRGTGLGLAVARRAAEQHGGTLHGETHPEGGAVFRLVLPGSARPMKHDPHPPSEPTS